MNDLDSYKQVIILFDEQGTPTFRADRETENFLGIVALFDLSDEGSIFKTTDALFGLSNSKPLKNADISVKRADEITGLLTDLPVQLVISSVNLSDSELERNVKLHEELGDLLRPIHRNVGGRRLSHIMHTAILDECIFHSICNYSKITQQNSNFLTYIDNWSIPKADTRIYLEERSRSLELKINWDFQIRNFQFHICVAPISLLNRDSQRKRFIDVLASVISRSFIQEDDERYSEKSLALVNNSDIHVYVDITKNIINRLRNFWNSYLREPPGF